jgi:hypothetical protein
MLHNFVSRLATIMSEPPENPAPNTLSEVTRVIGGVPGEKVRAGTG